MSDPRDEFFAALAALDEALGASDWTKAGQAAVRLERAALACTVAQVKLAPEALAQARALADRCGERVERAHAVAVGELAAFGSADRARLRYGR